MVYTAGGFAIFAEVRVIAFWLNTSFDVLECIVSQEGAHALVSKDL